MSKKKLSKLLVLYLPYVVIGLLATNLGEAWRLAVGKELGDKIVSHFQIRCPACTQLTCSLVCAAALECGWRCT